MIAEDFSSPRSATPRGRCIGAHGNPASSSPCSGNFHGSNGPRWYCAICWICRTTRSPTTSIVRRRQFDPTCPTRWRPADRSPSWSSGSLRPPKVESPDHEVHRVLRGQPGADPSVLTRARMGNARPARVRERGRLNVVSSRRPDLTPILRRLAGQSLAEFSVATTGIRLSFSSSRAGQPRWDVTIESEIVGVRRNGADTTRKWNDDAVATGLLKALDSPLATLDICGRCQCPSPLRVPSADDNAPGYSRDSLVEGARPSSDFE